MASKAARKARQYETKRQSLAFSKQPEARKARQAMASTWQKREQQPGNFHRPNGRHVMPAWNDAR